MKRFISIILGLSISLATTLSLIGCGGTGGGGNQVSDTEDTLQIYVWQGGYGTDWADALIESFQKQEWVKEKYPNLTILKTYNDNMGFVASRLSAGDRNTFDLMFGTPQHSYYGASGAVLDLTEVVYNSQVPGEDVLFSEKIDQSYKTASQYIDVKNPGKKSYYSVPWAGGMGAIIYNEDILNSFDLKVPNTTDELLAVCATIKANEGKDNGKYNRGESFIQAYDAVEYFEYLFPTWWAQYEGVTNYINFWNGIDNNRYSKNIFNQQGRRYALEVMDTILDYKNGYLLTDSFTLEYMASQLSFFNGNAVFHVNGDWLENEMRDLTKDIKDMDTFKTMRTPIISALGVKLGITDAQLSALVDYVDGVGEKPSFESTEGYTEEEVIEAVTEARSIVQSIGARHHAVIPKNATGKNVAIDFLRFMATDVAQQEYLRATGGNNLPFRYNVKENNGDLYNTFNPIHQSRLDYFYNGLYETYTLPVEDGFPLYSYGGVKPFINMNIYSTLSSSSNDKTVDDFMTETDNEWTEEKWDRALRLAGIY